MIAAINGWCLAGGFALALSCEPDLVIADNPRIGSSSAFDNCIVADFRSVPITVAISAAAA